MTLPRDLSLYNGVSNRSRGWKSRKTDKVMEGLMTSNTGVMRWDGAARSSAAWDNLRRDPALWFREGDCYVHLYAQGQSRRGPAFKVPFSGLTEASCYPLIDNFISSEISIPITPGSDISAYYRKTSNQNRVDLYIPAPPRSDKQQSYKYHLATRNFFAWIFRRSMVGEYLGVALITLMRSMHDFRTHDVDNQADLMSYLDEEGYLDFKSQPSHALAALHLAEVFQLRDLYIDAFAHCCGMSDQVFLGPEYQLLSSVTRKLLRRARVEMDLRLGQMGSMLGTLLQDELSETYLGLYPGARAHLERFRTLLNGLYAAKFGYYPPPSIDPRTTIFEVDVFRTMRVDFEALFQYLVDNDYEPSQSIPILAQGGICTLQSVQAFDTRQRFKTLDHPLPKMPEIAVPASSRRMSWLGRHFDVKIGPSQRAAAHVALLKATNQDKIALLDNDLVRAYRKFEEDSIYSPLKADKQENIGLIDARKVRWILIYSIYQVLRSATEPPSEVKDSRETPYHLCVATTNIPPWKEERAVHSLIRGQNSKITRNPSTSTAGWSGTTDYHTPPMTPEIKPDIDYLALARSDESTELSNGIKVPGRRSSISTNPVMRSMSIFNRQEKQSPQHQRKPTTQYHEIVVHGYGNGTNEVEFTQPQEKTQLSQQEQDQEQDQESLKIIVVDTNLKINNNTTTARSPSTSSDTRSSTASSNSEGSSGTTANTSVTESPTTTTYPMNSWGSRRSSVCVRRRVRDIGFIDGAAMRTMSMYEQTSPPRPHTQHGGPISTPDNSDSGSLQGSPSRFRSMSVQRDNRLSSSYRKSLEPLPLNIHKAATLNNKKSEKKRMGMGMGTSMVTATSPSKKSSVPSPNVWEDIKALVDVRSSGVDDIKAAWEMYNDLGGLTEMNDAAGTAVR
ncbi:uncharacterized protein BCR38DRAFT_227278 [Pseudomassariella vexata]|uniref:DUF8004 domain-containing protein n=1 Tax=Pseudomassariella vexata TaxID=1141098 RepID=A0A1Y2DVS8_9PEZI|nr:uncharacterized protein BCR38DRAFT_227278 [Pseudomassariella vexata]ORY63381.1 hypothetical protein BCR38DRAFT_227278 [Pseudomassariella vexata]